MTRAHSTALGVTLFLTALAAGTAYRDVSGDGPPPAVAAPPAPVARVTHPAPAGDWPMWGRTPDRNLLTPGTGAPVEWDVDKGLNIKWSADLGSKSYGGPVVTGGRVYVGTNNEAKRDPALVTPAGDAIDGGVLMCFDERTGKFLWQRYHAKLPSGRVNDWPGEGLTATPYTEPGRMWYCSNRNEVICLDTSRPGGEPPRELWKVDMMKQFGVFPHNATHCSPVAYDDLLFVITGNGVDDTHKNVVAPHAPDIVCFDKNTGAVVWKDNPAGANILHGQWTSPSIVEVNGRGLVVAPLGDGWVYAYDARTGRIVWRFDTNPKESIYPQTRNEILAAPVIAGKYMYIAPGQDPEHGTGYSRLWCVDITKEGDVSAELPADTAAPKPKAGEELVAPAGAAASRRGKPNPNSAVVWEYVKLDADGDGKIQETERMHRTISTVAVADGLLFAPDFSGYLHCLDAKTGERYWSADLEADIWASPLVVDGKVYLPDGDGDVHVFEASPRMKQLAVQSIAAAAYVTPVYANGVLYVMSMHKLYAIEVTK